VPRPFRDEPKSQVEETVMLTKTGIGVLAFMVTVSPLTAQKGSVTSDVRLRVSIADRSATPPPDYRVESDGMGDYVDGVDGVSARLDRYGNLLVNFQTDSRTVRRSVFFDYSCAADLATSAITCGNSPAEPPTGFQGSAYISTVCREVGTGLPCSSPRIQDMTIATGQCVQLNWEFTDGSGQSWRNGFHRNRDLPLQEGTAYAVVTRMDPDTWTVEPGAASCQTGMPGVARTFRVETVKSKWLFHDLGTFWLPFKLTVTRMTN
jgi:hypothetical protein